MIIRSISIRSKLILTSLVIFVLMAILSLMYLDASMHITSSAELLKEQSELQSEFHSLVTVSHRMALNSENNLAATSLNQIHRVEDQLRSVMLHEAVSDQEQVTHKSGQIFASLMQLAESLRYTGHTDSTRWVVARTHMEVLGNEMDEMDLLLSKLIHRDRKKQNIQLGISLSLGIILLITCLIIFAVNIGWSFRKTSTFINQLQSGKLPPPIEFNSEDEFGQIARDLNHHVVELQKKIGLITSMSREGPGEIYQPDAEDELGNALVVLTDYMTRKELEEVTRNREDKKQNWISEGVAQLGEVLRSERENVTELSFKVIQKLVTYMRLEMGTLFLTNESDPDKLSLDQVASYAYDRRKYFSGNLEWGVGLPGTCAQEMEPIFVTEVPDDYFEITSGVGTSKPNCILLVPLKIDDRVHGVIELATVRLLRPFEIDFVVSLSERITSSLLAVRNSERTSELLKQSQAQAVALKDQEAAMRENMNKLEQAQEESSKSESEISGILNAINQSTLVAELDLTGRFSRINDGFLSLLEFHRDQVVGKQHSEFAQVDQYSDDYKNFWTLLREGKSVSNTEMYKLFSGKEVWLEQTFTPIINNEGEVYKILNIAVDITSNRALQNRLDTLDLEIIRSGLELQTLNQAVNASLIKCELDAEGIIVEVNEKYNEVTGYGRNELLGRNYRMFLKDSEKDQFENIWKKVSKDKVYEGVIRRSKPNGEEVWLVSTYSPVKDEAGNIYKVYFMGLDITEKKLKYQLLEEANREVERLKEQLKNYET